MYAFKRRLLKIKILTVLMETSHLYSNIFIMKTLSPNTV